MHDIIDLERFPLDRLDSDAGRALVARCQADLERDGLFNLVEFMFPAVIEQMLPQLQPLIDHDSFTHQRRHNVYFLPQVDDLRPDHPALREFDTTNHTVCSDQIPDSPLVRLYHWPPFAAFLAAVMGLESLHPMDDPLACMNVMGYRDGEALNWHFDRSEFTTTLLLQGAEQGGDFQYRTGLRSDEDPNYAGVGEFLSGDQADAQTLKLTPGTLNVFRGKNTLHRVSPVRGDKNRIITVFSYYEQAGVKFSREENIGFYGRAS